MLAKERSDMQFKGNAKNLKESEIRFQQIVKQLLKAFLFFDESYRITFSNKNMASMLGYTVDEMLERSYASFFPESQLDVYNYQESLRKKGAGSVYECCLIRKDGKITGFCSPQTNFKDDYGRFEGLLPC